MLFALALVVLVFAKFGSFARTDEEYDIGVGIADVTGPAADINMMGYAKGGQDTAGIHFRLYSRAFIVADKNGARVCYVTIDAAMVSQAVKIEVVKMLQKKFNGMYTEENVMITATHTHSGPGGFLQYVLYIITSQGFISQSFEAIVSGIVESIGKAHNNMTTGYIYWNEGELLDTRYAYDTDKTMTVLKFVDTSGNPLGVISWFAVHATSMNNSNKLVSGDNKGYASLLFEQSINGGTLHGKGPFVAIFAQSNEGDVSPNIKGPRCIDTGLVCDIATSTCNGENEKCIASGPGRDMYESTKIIGTRQFAKAKQLFDDATNKLKGPVQYIHQQIDMSNVAIIFNGNVTVSTCKSAMGYSFAAGTIDGPGAFDFQQGDTSSSPFWNLVRDFLRKPSQDLIDCQYPKPILIATGEMSFPYAWQPSILPTQLLKIGPVVIAGVPAEFTSMSGRRLRAAIKNKFKDFKIDVNVAIAGLSNAYSSYVTTFEEYQIQRYEGASTIFGPHTLDAYIQQFMMLSAHMATKQPIEPGPAPPNLLNRQISLKPGVIYDGSPFGHKFGDVVRDAEREYVTGSTVAVSFISGHPRNDMQLGGTFLSVERWNNSSHRWDLVATDGNWETKFLWRRTNTFFGESQATVIWEIPHDAPAGTYRIRHFGHSKNLMQQIKSYIGVSNSFTVISSQKFSSHL